MSRFRLAGHLLHGCAGVRDIARIEHLRAPGKRVVKGPLHGRVHVAANRGLAELHPRTVSDRQLAKHPDAVTQSSIERNGRSVVARVTASAPVYGLQEVVVNQGDEVTFIVTNTDEIPDLAHGFAISNYNVSFVVGPFQTKSVTITADKPGVFWIYCTNFCHALHLEMRMRLVVNATT